jgi:hypothetical protein
VLVNEATNTICYSHRLINSLRPSTLFRRVISIASRRMKVRQPWSQQSTKDARSPDVIPRIAQTGIHRGLNREQPKKTLRSRRSSWQLLFLHGELHCSTTSVSLNG